MQCHFFSHIRAIGSTSFKSSKHLIGQHNVVCARKVTNKPVLDKRSQEARGKYQELHVSVRKSYPATKAIPLPNNIEEIDESELVCFSPQRDRDISNSVILSKTDDVSDCKMHKQVVCGDPHLDSYDCRGALSLNSAMQTNVPVPFSPRGKATHLNMPGGQWGQSQKYISEDMQNNHYTKVLCYGSKRHMYMQRAFKLINQEQSIQNQFSLSTKLPNHALDKLSLPKYGFRSYSTSNSSNTSSSELTRKEKLMRAVKEYGSTVIIFHVGISLLSLGGCYLAVTSGMNVVGVLKSLGPGSEVAVEAGQFVIAYTVHKIFAPVRISITLAATPFIVRYLRKIGFLKPSKHGI